VHRKRTIEEIENEEDQENEESTTIFDNETTQKFEVDDLSCDSNDEVFEDSLGYETRKTKDLERLLEKRPQHVECRLIHECLYNWLSIYEMNNPSPFTLHDKLSEHWWMKSAWGVCTSLAKDIPGCFVIPGEKTIIDSSVRRNKDRESTSTHKKFGTRSDLIWRDVRLPETDWAVAEAAKAWCPQNNKYISESKFKLPRQLHDILIGRSMEVGGANELRKAIVSGLIIGGNNASTTSTMHLMAEYELAEKRFTSRKKKEGRINLSNAMLEPKVSWRNLLQS
ncbi:hypothetical protein BX616_006687, partial [Lobosporangium transversale]